MLNEDYKDMLLALSGEKVKYLLVGAFALAAHGIVRSTIDIDIWVSPEKDNTEALFRALVKFGAPVEQIAARDFESENVIYQIGVAPRRIDIITTVSGLRFDEVYPNSIEAELGGIVLRIPSISDLILNKKASGRPKDMLDVTELEKRI
tara:strand:- start:2842 stop:3288 length:447 start_codon:yes stop_codon:yes gene_type:complete